MLEILQIVESLFTVEHPDVLRLSRCELANGPREVHEVRLHRRMHRMHPDLTRQAVRFARVARAARGYDVGLLVGAAARQWNQMIACE